jgi:hypothetical protein
MSKAQMLNQKRKIKIRFHAKKESKVISRKAAKKAQRRQGYLYFLCVSRWLLRAFA